MSIGIPGPTSHVYFSQRLRLHYVDWGNDDAPPLLLVHGGRDHCRTWDWVAQAFREDYHVIAPDLRGHGDSQWVIGAQYAIIDYVYDMATLIDQKQLQPLTIVGHSLGGNVSLLYSGVFPDNVKRLVSVEGWGPPPDAIRTRADKSPQQRMAEWIHMLRGMAGRDARAYETIDAAVRRMRDANPHLTPEQARHLTIHGTNQNEDGTYTWSSTTTCAPRRRIASTRPTRTTSGRASPARCSCCGAARVGPRTPSRRNSRGTSAMSAASPSRRPGIGCTTTAWTSSSRRWAPSLATSIRD